jgi:hypothetical protein
MGVTHITNKSAEDPKATGLVEAFMKHHKKIFHTAGVEKEDPYTRLNEYLMQRRATPHSTMEKSPAELLFGRKFNTRLPDLRTNPARERADIIEAKKVDKLAKERMKRDKDKGRYVREHNIGVGDLVIAKRKSTKHESPYDSKPYRVQEVHGTQIKATREDGKQKTRDSQKWKKVEVQPRRRYKEVGSRDHVSTYLEDTNIGVTYQGEEGREQGQGEGQVGTAQGRAAQQAHTEDRGAGLDVAVSGGAAGVASNSDTDDQEEGEATELDVTVELEEQYGGQAAAPSPRQSQGHDGTDMSTRARKRVNSVPGTYSGNYSYGSSSSRDSNSIIGEHERRNPNTVRTKRRRRSGRQSNPLERHRHYSMIGVRHPSN